MPKRANLDEVERYEGMDVTAQFEWFVGELMEKFLDSLADKKILGAECPECGYTYVPPRERCGECYAEIGEDDLTEVSDKGTLESYTQAHVELDGKGNLLDLEESKIIGSVKLEDADTRSVFPLGETDLGELETGMEVEVVWKDEAEGEISDIKYFKPV